MTGAIRTLADLRAAMTSLHAQGVSVDAMPERLVRGREPAERRAIFVQLWNGLSPAGQRQVLDDYLAALLRGDL